MINEGRADDNNYTLFEEGKEVFWRVSVHLRATSGSISRLSFFSMITYVRFFVPA